MSEFIDVNMLGFVLKWIAALIILMSGAELLYSVHLIKNPRTIKFFYKLGMMLVAFFVFSRYRRDAGNAV